MAKKKKSVHPAKDACRIPIPPDEAIGLPGPVEPRMSDITWRIFRIMAEFVEGFQFLSSSSREVAIFGSARFVPGSKWYKVAEDLGKLLAKNKFTVLTGGGPGIMEGANKGAMESGGESLGINIQLPREQRINPYVTRSSAFHYFFVRKVILAASSQAYVFFPGGFGTMDEFFEIVTLIQTKKMQTTPIICVGREFWEPLNVWIKAVMKEKLHSIAPEDMNLYRIVDTAKEAFEFIKDSEERTIF